jgi:hypothetical protein
MSGYLKNFEKQIDALSKVYYELIHDIENKVSLENWWVFGGGTALAMFHFNHRKSFDIDIFVTEAQVFDLAVAISKNDEILKDLVESRFISYEDLEKLNESLNSLNLDLYNLELEKIEPQSDEYLDIANRAKEIIQTNIEKLKIY